MSIRKAKKLPSSEYLKSILHYDPETGVFKWKHREDMPNNWNKRRAGTKAGSKKINTPHRSIKINNSFYYEHRLAWAYVYGDVLTEHIDIDHKNNNGGDNRIINLRIASHSQNMANRKSTAGRLLPKGVHKSRHKYRAIIRIDNKNINLGTYITPEEAQKAYYEAAVSYRGEFARRG